MSGHAGDGLHYHEFGAQRYGHSHPYLHIMHDHDPAERPAPHPVDRSAFPLRTWAAEGARVGLASCWICGAALLVDPDDRIDVVQKHYDWHRRLGHGDPASTDEIKFRGTGGGEEQWP